MAARRYYQHHRDFLTMQYKCVAVPRKIWFSEIAGEDKVRPLLLRVLAAITRYSGRAARTAVAEQCAKSQRFCFLPSELVQYG